MTTYLFLFFVSFLAATIFPFSSELTLVSLLKVVNNNPFLLLAAASVGNILGSVFNWFLGFYLLRHIKKKWFPFSKHQIYFSSKQFNKFGIWSLLFAWLPIIGDALTFVAGILRVNIFLFLILVSIGKTIRYLVLYFTFNNLT
jgi:membrane protein YqaA with SNARE-associated domain